MTIASFFCAIFYKPFTIKQGSRSTSALLQQVLNLCLGLWVLVRFVQVVLTVRIQTAGWRNRRADAVEAEGVRRYAGSEAGEIE